jgi:hypothetical protein
MEMEWDYKKYTEKCYQIKGKKGEEQEKLDHLIITPQFYIVLNSQIE